jgi:hypothetical protein
LPEERCVRLRLAVEIRALPGGAGVEHAGRRQQRIADGRRESSGGNPMIPSEQDVIDRDQLTGRRSLRDSRRCRAAVWDSTQEHTVHLGVEELEGETAQGVEAAERGLVKMVRRTAPANGDTRLRWFVCAGTEGKQHVGDGTHVLPSDRWA